MATEGPQSLPVDQKVPSPTPVEKMAVDEPVSQTVNGHAKLDEDQTQPDDKPTTNGKAKSPAPTDEIANESQNRQAFAANSSLPEQIPSKSTSELPDASDSEMTGVNGTSVAEEKTSPVAEEKTSPVAEEKTSPVAESKSEEPAKIPTPRSVDAVVATKDSAEDAPVSEPPADSMDVDVSTQRPDLMSSADHVDSTQETSAISDAPVVSSPHSSQQAAELSKLDIKSAQDDAPISQADVSMADPPASPAKISREREEDAADERAAKRAKRDDASEAVADSLVVASGFSPAPQTTGQTSEGTIPDTQIISSYQNKQLRQALASIKKTKNGANFRQSVERLWPFLWNDYKSKVENPVDIAVFETKLREDSYANYGAFKADVRLLYENSVIFNGPQNPITVAAGTVRDQVFMRLPEISKMEEPAKPEKGKAQPTRHAEPRAATQPRRQSDAHAQAIVTSPKSKPEAPAPPPSSTPTSSTATRFAVPPGGIPQIRRDSTLGDGNRPKRPIHPPKSRDLDYTSKANRKRKLEPEQRFFEMVMEELKKPKYMLQNQWFMIPVDPVALNIPQYFKIIKKPMDLGTMTRKNYEGDYKTSKDIEKDMKQIVHNAETFNGPDHEVTKLAKELEVIFKSELAKKDQWMERNYPPEAPAANASAPSPERSPHDSEDESDADADDDDNNEAIRGLQVRMNEEQDKLNTLLGSKKPDLTMIEIQQTMVTMIQRKLVEEKTKFHSDGKKPKAKKKSSNSKSKPKTSGSGAASGTSKKAAASHAAAPKKSSANSKKAAPKRRIISGFEKAVIAEGINELDGNTLTKAVEIIKRDTGQNENDDGEMELDIDALSMEALGKLYDLITRAHPTIRGVVAQRPEWRDEVAAEAPPAPKAGAAPKAKKNKPMNKHEQERKIEQLKELKAQLQRQGSGSQEPVPAGAEEQRPAESSEEESDSEEE